MHNADHVVSTGKGGKKLTSVTSKSFLAVKFLWSETSSRLDADVHRVVPKCVPPEMYGGNRVN